MSMLLDRIKGLMDESGITAKQLTREVGISNSSFTDWGKGKGSPSLDAVIKFSDYFNVSIDWLVRGVEHDTAEKLEFSSQKDAELLNKFHSLTPELQDKLLAYTDGMIAAMPTENNIEKRLSI